jgi:CheY-like chemotaxis protein
LELYHALCEVTRTPDAGSHLSSKETAGDAVAPVGARILVAEDVAVNQEIIQELVRQSGFECDCVSNGHDAVEAALNGNYDLLLMDCQMPGTDGYMAAEQIREAEPASRLPIIAVTASAVEEDLQRCLDVGMNAYLTKPVHPATLETTILSCLRREEVTSPPVTASVQEGREAPIFDRAVFLRRCGNRIELVERVMTKFVEQAEEDLQELRAVSARGDTRAVARLARRFSGAASDLAAEALRRAAVDAEEAAREKRTQMIPAAIARLETEFKRLKQHLVWEELPQVA